MQQTTLVVMAAGIGSRFGGLKQLAPVGPSGEITLAYSVYDAIRAGFNRVAFIIRPAMEAAFRDAFGRHVEARVDTAYIHQKLDSLPSGFSAPDNREKPWGTGHAILCCRDAVRTPFAVINADDFYGREAYDALHRFLSRPAASATPEYAMAGFILERTLSPHGHVARGVCRVSADGYLMEIIERTKIQRVDGHVVAGEGDKEIELPPQAIVSMNMWGFTPDLFNDLEERFAEFLRANIANVKAEFYLPVVIDALIREKRARVKVLPTTAEWHGVTYREDLPEVQGAVRALVQRGEYPAPLFT